MHFLVTWQHFVAVTPLSPDSSAQRLADGVYAYLRHHNVDLRLRAAVIPDSFGISKTIGFDYLGLLEISKGELRRTRLYNAVGAGSGELLDHVVEHVGHLVDKLPAGFLTGHPPLCPTCGHDDMWLIWPQYFCGKCDEIVIVERSA